MAIVPNGSPAWERTSDHTTYGGDLNKTNWHSQGVTNARTDVGAEALCRLCEDLSAVARTAPFCVLTIACDDVTPGPPTVSAINQMTGVTVTPYVGNAPPLGLPSVARNGNGDVTVTWAASYSDAYGISGDVNIVHADVGAQGTTPAFGTYELDDVDSNGLNEVVRVRIFSDAGAAVANAVFSLTVVTGT